jgi:hypothetical protein
MPMNVLGASFNAFFDSLSNGRGYFIRRVFLGGSYDNAQFMAACLYGIVLVLRSLDAFFK